LAYADAYAYVNLVRLNLSAWLISYGTMFFSRNKNSFSWLMLKPLATPNPTRQCGPVCFAKIWFILIYYETKTLFVAEKYC
jgi:hypothetical protein